MGEIRPKIIPALFTSLIVLSFASQFWAIDPALARTHTIWSMVLMGGAICVWGVGQMLPAPQWHKLWNIAISIAVGVNGIVALLQFVRQHEVGLSWLGEKPTLRPEGGYSIVQIGNTLTLRAYGLTTHPNILGGLFAAALIMLIVQNPSLGWFNKAVLWIGFCGLLVTFSRSGWLAFLLVFLFLAISRQSTFFHQKISHLSNRWLLISTTLTLLLGLFVVSNSSLIQARLQPRSVAELRSVSERLLLTKQALILIRQYPFIGVGANNFVAALPAGLMNNMQPVHNMLLLLSAELGLPAGLIWLLITLLPLWITYKRAQAGRATQFEIALAAALLTCVITDQFDMYAWRWSNGRTARGLLLALWLVEAERSEKVTA